MVGVVFGAPGAIGGETELGDAVYREAVALKAASASPDEMEIAIRSFEEAAAFGNARSLIALGAIYGGGELVDRDEVRAKAYYDRAVLEGLEPEALRGIAALLRSREGDLYDPGAAREYYERASALGDAASSAVLADMYATGEGITVDEVTARLYFEKAIGAGNAGNVLPKLAELLRTPEGELYDAASAVDLFERAVAVGHSRSLVSLGEMYAAGEGVKADEAKAKTYFERAASEGFEKDTSRKLAAMFRSADGNLHDPAKAEELYRRAAELGDTRSLLVLGEMHAAGEGVSADETTARDYYRQAAAVGLEREAVYDLAALYLSPTGKLHDSAEAIRLYERAAALGDANALVKLGDIYAEGSGVAVDEAKALGYYARAVEVGLLTNVAPRVASLFQSPEGELYDLGEALRYFEQAAALGDVRAVLSLGRLYAEGAGVEFDELKAKALFELAAVGEFEREAYRRLAGLYRSPDGALYDIGEAIRLFEQAAEMGDVWSMTSLGEMYASGEALGATAGNAPAGQANGTH